MNTEEIIDMARQIATTFGTRMCDENGDTHGEELYAMGIDDIIDTIKLVDAKATARERLGCFEAAYGAYATTAVLEAIRNRGDL